jgi:hypothetical protein
MHPRFGLSDRLSGSQRAFRGAHRQYHEAVAEPKTVRQASAQCHLAATGSEHPDRVAATIQRSSHTDRPILKALAAFDRGERSAA